MVELQNELITLVDEDGNEHQFLLLDIVNVNDNDYAIMVVAEEAAADDEEEEAVIFRIEEGEDGQQSLIVVDEDEEWEAVVAAWEEMIGLEEEE